MGCKNKIGRINIFFLFLQDAYRRGGQRISGGIPAVGSAIGNREKSDFSTTVRNFVDNPTFFFHKFLFFLTNPFFPQNGKK
jgi:hypothetical protein